MSFNPFEIQPLAGKDTFYNWTELSTKPYNKLDVAPSTRMAIILANGCEYQSVWLSHQHSRNCDDNNIRRDIAILRKQEQQQQKRISGLKPINESLLEHTIGYEQLAVELTAMMAQRENNKYVKNALDFALLEDFDHLYRYADLLEMDKGIASELIVGDYTEIMPGRPTIAHHRYPTDDIKRYTNYKHADLLTKLHITIITAAEQQTMNYYMSQANFYPNKLGRQLLTEVAMVEEQHVSLYGSLMDTNCSLLSQQLMNEYTECYLYYSLMTHEKDPYVKKVFESHLDTEIFHLHYVAQLLEKYEKKHYEQVIGKGAFPELLTLGSNIEYIRTVLSQTVNNTSLGEDYIDCARLDPDSNFFLYQRTVNNKEKQVPSHNVIEKYIADHDIDYRQQFQEHPIEQLQDRHHDNTTVGRT